VDVQASATDGPLGSPPLGLGGLVGTPIKKHTGGSLNLVQTLLDFGRTHNTVRARREEVKASEEQLQSDRNRVTLEVRQAYLQALQARALVEVNQRLLEQRRLVARQAETLRANGLASRVDVDLAELNVSQSELALVRARNDVEIAFASLSAAVGRIIPSATSLSEPAPSAVSESGLGESLKAADEGRPELRQIAAQERAFRHLESAAKAGKRPLVTGVGSVGKINPVPLFEAGDKPFAVGLALTVPVFTGGMVEGQTEEARRNAVAAGASREELRNQVRQQVTAAVSSVAAAQESIRVAQAQQVRAQDALSLATQRYQSQLGSIVELSQAQVAAATAEYDLLRARYDLELARAALDFATGRGAAGPGTGK
jgi:outer membrane protein